MENDKQKKPLPKTAMQDDMQNRGKQGDKKMRDTQPVRNEEPKKPKTDEGEVSEELDII